MIIENKYDIGQCVYLRTDVEQKKRLCVGIHVCPGNRLVYELSAGAETTENYDFEISADPDLALK